MPCPGTRLIRATPLGGLLCWNKESRRTTLDGTEVSRACLHVLYK